MPPIAQMIRSSIKDLAMWTGVYNKTFFGVYPFCFEPKQLIVLTECVKAVANVPGCFVEGGCLYGATCVFLNKFADEEGINPRPYYAIDTFAGFPYDDAKYEVTKRGKSTALFEVFRENKKAWFDTTMKLHHVKRVKSVQSDITRFDFGAIAPIAFCLLDVDLYTCTKDVLPKIYAAMSPGGIIVVDDCKPKGFYDGAAEAYEEFVKERGLPSEIVETKLGIIRVARHQDTMATAGVQDGA
jgi:hypothetical protein